MRKQVVKRVVPMVTAVILAGSLMGCGGGYKSQSAAVTDSAYSSNYYSGDTKGEMCAAEEEAACDYDMEMAYPAEAPAAPGLSVSESNGAYAGAIGTDSGAGAVDPMANKAQKLIRTIDLNMETKDMNTCLEAIYNYVDEFGGYVENSSVDTGNYSWGRGTAYANLTVRIPSDRLNAFTSQVSELSNVTYRSENVEDVTLQYVDVESHKKALETEQERLLELMERAETTEDLITIESRLSEIRYQLQNYESRLRTMDNQVNYSTVYMNISEVEVVTPAQPKTFWEEAMNRLERNCRRLASNFRSFLIGLIANLPELIIWAIVIVIGVIAGKKIIRRRRAKKDKTAE